MNLKEKAVLARISRIEEAILKSYEYLATGKHAHWNGFRAWFSQKVRNGKELPPHRDWVKNVFLLRQQRALREAEIALEKVTRKA
jgi:hypothetical protein